MKARRSERRKVSPMVAMMMRDGWIWSLYSGYEAFLRVIFGGKVQQRMERSDISRETMSSVSSGYCLTHTGCSQPHEQ